MASPEELLGLIQGLTGAIRERHNSSKEITWHAQQQIQYLSTAVRDLSASLTSREPSQTALRLPLLCWVTWFWSRSFDNKYFCNKPSHSFLERLRHLTADYCLGLNSSSNSSGHVITCRRRACDRWSSLGVTSFAFPSISPSHFTGYYRPFSFTFH